MSEQEVRVKRIAIVVAAVLASCGWTLAADAPTSQITTEYLPGGLLEAPRLSSHAGVDEASTQFVLPNEGISLDEAELSFVRQAINRSGGNQTRAAALLGISRDQLRYRLKKLEEVQGAAVADTAT